MTRLVRTVARPMSGESFQQLLPFPALQKKGCRGQGIQAAADQRRAHLQPVQARAAAAEKPAGNKAPSFQIPCRITLLGGIQFIRETVIHGRVYL